MPLAPSQAFMPCKAHTACHWHWFSFKRFEGFLSRFSQKCGFYSRQSNQALTSIYGLEAA
jgi:hypothetical protein